MPDGAGSQKIISLQVTDHSGQHGELTVAIDEGTRAGALSLSGGGTFFNSAVKYISDIWVGFSGQIISDPVIPTISLSAGPSTTPALTLVVTLGVGGVEVEQRFSASPADCQNYYSWVESLNIPKASADS